MTKWFIDSLDVLGGRAFASSRAARSDADPPHENGGYFMAAPDFAPEPIASASTALAATHGMFQLGLLNEQGNEIPFGRLEDIVEFVRRAYSSGGSGDGGDGDAGPPPMPDSGSPTDPKSDPDEKLEKGAAIRQLETALKEFGAASDKLEEGDPGVPITIHPHHEKDHTSLRVAGRVVLGELLRRFPGFTDDEAASRWSNTALATGELLHATGLINEILVRATEDEGDRFGRAASTIATRWFTESHLPEWDLRPYVLARLLGAAPAWQYVYPRRAPGELLREFESGRRPDGGYGRDPFSLLFVIPVSDSISRLVKRVSREPMSLGNLLSFVLGAPHSAMKFGDKLPHVLSLCLLASAFIVARDRMRHGSPIPNGNPARMNELTSDALNWMIANLPSIALPHSVEVRIGHAAAMPAGRASNL